MICRNIKVYLFSIVGSILLLAACKSDVDTDLPYILLSGSNPYYIDSIGGHYVEPGYKGLDDVDGELTSSIIVDYPSILTDSAKSYEIKYSLTDKSGNTFTTHRTVVVRNTAGFLEGFFTRCSQYCDTDSSASFAASILASSVNNDAFSIRNFGNFGQTANINCSLDRVTGKISIATPQFLADSSSTIDNIIADSTYITNRDSLTFQVYFTYTKNGHSANCRTFYKK